MMILQFLLVGRNTNVDLKIWFFALNVTDGKQKNVLLLNHIGAEAYEVYKNLTLKLKRRGIKMLLLY